MTLAPLVIKDKVVVGVAGGEYGIRGFVAAYEAKHGKGSVALLHHSRARRTGPRNLARRRFLEARRARRCGSPDPIDPDLNLTYWGIGNPGPDWNASQRKGDNLYSDSALALDADTGKLKWHFQFTPNDAYDYDSVQVPVAGGREWDGKSAQVDVVGQSQRLLLRAGPHQRQVPLRPPLRQDELGQRIG